MRRRDVACLQIPPEYRGAAEHLLSALAEHLPWMKGRERKMLQETTPEAIPSGMIPVLWRALEGSVRRSNQQGYYGHTDLVGLWQRWMREASGYDPLSLAYEGVTLPANIVEACVRAYPLGDAATRAFLTVESGHHQWRYLGSGWEQHVFEKGGVVAKVDRDLRTAAAPPVPNLSLLRFAVLTKCSHLYAPFLGYSGAVLYFTHSPGVPLSQILRHRRFAATVRDGEVERLEREVHRLREHGLYMLDLKPDNIIVSPAGEFLVVDGILEPFMYKRHEMIWQGFKRRIERRVALQKAGCSSLARTSASV